MRPVRTITAPPLRSDDTDARSFAECHRRSMSTTSDIRRSDDGRRADTPSCARTLRVDAEGQPGSASWPAGVSPQYASSGAISPRTTRSIRRADRQLEAVALGEVEHEHRRVHSLGDHVHLGQDLLEPAALPELLADRRGSGCTGSCTWRSGPPSRPDPQRSSVGPPSPRPAGSARPALGTSRRPVCCRRHRVPGRCRRRWR